MVRFAGILTVEHLAFQQELCVLRLMKFLTRANVMTKKLEQWKNTLTVEKIV